MPQISEDVRKVFPEVADMLDAAFELKKKKGTVNRPTVGKGGLVNTAEDIPKKLAEVMVSVEKRFMADILAPNFNFISSLGHPLTLMFMIGVHVGETKQGRLATLEEFQDGSPS